MAINVLATVAALQETLSHAAKQSLERRFGALFDKVYRDDVLWQAWDQVRRNGGGPGIDKETIESIENQIGVSAFLRELRDELKSETYRAQPDRLDRFVMNRLRIFVKRKHNDPCRGMRRVSCELFDRLGLLRLARGNVSFI